MKTMGATSGMKRKQGNKENIGGNVRNEMKTTRETSEMELKQRGRH